MVDFPKPWKSIWNAWDIRVFLLTSLLLQILLTMLSPLRRRTASKSFSLFIWSVYLLADWVADFALGLLCNSQGNSGCNDTAHLADGTTEILKSTTGAKQSTNREYNDKLLAFWAPFLLLHLGGPDTISAFAMEDNELWTRHLLGLFFEVGGAVYVFLLSIPKNPLLAPTLLMFLAGMIKYGERTYALYLASSDGFRESMLRNPDPGPNYDSIMQEYGHKLDSGVPARIDIGKEPMNEPLEQELQEQQPAGEQEQQNDDEVAIIIEAHRFFKKSKALIVEHLQPILFSFHELNKSQRAFWEKPAKEAFRVIEYELNFLYEVLFTKAAVVHHWYSYILRAICTCSIVGAFLSFFFLSKKHKLSPLDKAINYTLLGGAISLDTWGFIMLLLSDWTIVKLDKYGFGKWISRFLVKIPPHNRWSVTVTQHNLINSCIRPEAEISYLKSVKDRPTILGKVDEIFCIQRALRRMHIGVRLMDEIQYTWHEDMTDPLKVFIFEELRKKGEGVRKLKEMRHISSRRGDWALNGRGYLGEFGNSVVDVEFDESLLRWHIATDLCYYTEEDMGKEEEDKQESKKDISVSIKASKHRRFCKILSDYLVYLLVMRPLMTPSFSLIGQMRYRDTCAEAKSFFLRRTIEGDGAEEKQRNGCIHLLSVNTKVEPAKVKGNKSKSVMFDACILAKKLKTLEVEDRWEMMCEVWTEMLIYAAGRCPVIAHARGLSKGGELLTFVWFFMSHLQLLEEPYQVEFNQIAKLTVDK